jgi:PAS domain S-box-containing protein
METHNTNQLRQEIATLKDKNALLEARICRLGQVEETLNAILNGTSAQTGADFFNALVQYLARAFQTKYAFVGELIDPEEGLVQTLAYWQDEGFGQNFQYTLSGTPCETVIGQGVRYYPENVAACFPNDEPLAKKNIVCYLGAPLVDSAGEPLGVLAVMGDRQIEMGQDSLPIIQIFAARAGAELARKRSLEKLSGSEQRYRNLVEQSNEAIFLAYKNRFEFVNECFCRMFDLSEAEILGGKLSLTGIVAPDSIPLFRERYEKWASGESVPEQFEFEARTADGRILPVSVSVSYVPYREGTAVQGILWNLEQRKQIEADERTQRKLAEALAQQNAQLLQEANQRADALRTTGEILRLLNSASNIRDTLPDVVNTLRSATGCQRISLAQIHPQQPWVQLFNLTESPIDLETGYRLAISDTPATSNILSGKPHLSPDVRSELSFLSAQKLYEEGIRSYVALPLHVDGAIKGVVTLGWPVEHGYEEAQLPFLAQIADAIALGVERSRLFSQTQSRTEELNLINRVISAAASGLSEPEITQIVCQEIAEYLSVDHVSLMKVDESLSTGFVAAQYIGPSLPSLVGKELRLPPRHPIIREISARYRPILIEDATHATVDAATRRLAAAYNLVSVLLVPIYLRGNLRGIMSVGSTVSRAFKSDEIRLAHTISEELGRILETARLYNQLRHYTAELEERVAERTRELAEANAQLKELDGLKSQFVSDVSHELRTPVTNLKLYLDLLEHRGAELLPQYLPILKKQVNRLGQLIEDILDISRLDMRRGQPFAFALVNLNNVVLDVFNAHQLRAEVAGLSLSFNPFPDLPFVLAEYNQLSQVVTNLLVNAINYTPSGWIRVETRLSASGQWVCLAVTDSGIGIDGEDIAYLFNRFYRGQTARQSNIPGTGLGLAIVQEIVQLHGGHLEVFSQPGEGSKFTVFLPRLGAEVTGFEFSEPGLD